MVLGNRLAAARKPEARGKISWWRSTFALSIGGGLLLRAAFPPIAWSWLAWLAPLPWLWLISQPQLPGRRPYLSVWFASLLHWLLLLQGIRLAHPVNHIGWLVLSAYLAVYLPLFFALTRLAVHRERVPLVIAAPVVWTGLELVRGVLFTGFSMGLLGHTQFENTVLIQIAELGGAYAVSFLVILVAACAARVIVIGADERRAARWPIGVISAALAVTIGHGMWRLAPATADGAPEGEFKAALIQSDFNTRFVYDPERNDSIFRRYWQLTEEVRDRHPDLDLIVWPESVFTGNLPELLLDGQIEPRDGLDVAQLEERAAAFRMKAREVARRINRPPADERVGALGIHLLVGTETVRLRGSQLEQFNSALLIDPKGDIVQRYYKMHPVMFGEYIPFGRRFPWIYRWTPMAQGLTPGGGPVAMEVDGMRLSPSICFESAVPHLIRRQTRELLSRDLDPDVLVNLTHDGWFWGSCILDLQLAGAVFRAIELGRPCLVAANAGISAWIDDRGRILARGPRRGEAQLVARISRMPPGSPYAALGDWLSGACLLATALLLIKVAATGGSRSD